MTLKQFIEENNVTSYDVIEDNLIINALVGEAVYGLDVDTSNIPAGTPTVNYDIFTLVGDILTVDNITINTNDVNMLGFTE